MEQLNIFELTRPKYKITKPIRLVELFAGIGSQAKALQNIGANFEHYKVVEFDKYAIASYNSIHNTNFETLDVTKIKGEDLEIVDTDKYEYILTYSFPCQDLSLAGKGAGMEKGTNTRSGLLWEVERLLEECLELPQILLMENVPQVISKANYNDFREWEKKLESLGYSNYYKNLNAKDFGIPQNRNRTFMVSVLGDYYYEFPRKKKLKLRLKDMLEDEVEEKYYLSEQMIQGMQNTKFESYKLENKLLDKDGIANTIISRFEGTPQCITIPEATKKGYAEAEEGDGIYLDRPHQKRGVVQKGKIQTIKTSPNDVGVVVEDTRNLKEKLADDLIESGTVKGGETINHSYTNSKKNPNSRLVLEDFVETRDGIVPTLTTIPDTLGVVQQVGSLRIRKLTPKECWRLMGFDDEDYDKASKVNSNAQVYKQAGNSIVVNVLEAIFRELF